MLLLIDADPIVYRCGFAAEATGWHIIYENAKGEVDEIAFDPTEDTTAGEQMREWLAFNEGQITILDKTRVVRPDPVSYALRATKIQVESIISECEEHYKQPGKMLMWISGRGGSYRDKIARVRPYKGNRDPTHKPFHYDAIRDYLRTSYHSFVTHGIEADDAVSIFAHNQLAIGGSSYVICTIDKDLDQIPGNHYNYMNKVHYAITQQESERWFVYQLLAGDQTDNIVGVWKCGPKQALESLKRMDFSADERFATAGATPVQRNHGRLRVSGDTGGDDAESRSYSSNSSADTSQSRRDSTAASGGVDGSHRADFDGQSREPARQTDPAGRISGPVGISAALSSASGSGDAAGRGAATAADRPRHNESDVERTAADSAAYDRGNTAEGSGIAKGLVPQPRLAPSWWSAVVRAYAESQRRVACPYAKDNPETIAIEMAQLVKLQEYPGQLWHPHGDLVVPGFGEEDFDG
jgi:hypothetical protein